MLCPAAANDNGDADQAPAIDLRARTSDDLGARLGRLQAEAQRANLDALAFILAMAAREAHRVSGWEQRVRDELDAVPGLARRLTD